MKHNLFLTMLAAALLGGQVFAETAEYRVSDYFFQTININDNEATLIVDAIHYPCSNLKASGPACLTLDYQVESSLDAEEKIDTPNLGILNITTTIDSVATEWEAAFSVENGGFITLCSASEGIDDSHGLVQFFGKDKDSTVKLGDSDVKFVGLVDALSWLDALSALDMNQVGIVWGSRDITLVGKIGSSPTPEPTTGSLSLLALAGLCARRRK